ncbi:type VI secretion system tube protein TssD [Apibacter adventoris]|uniref:Type VI secretion system needle protein Hcp n=1 Tax=Apibacter adventoris TaxID=1679466 RepID=A0A2S8AFS2_9FLAO|nr:type VI secretion system tube protein TssD [Apibacter adventoris]PQL90675.1 hypothetical protein C4S77_12435 [Apibacter adventoris]PQL91081.1 hypothetical protein C4S77_09515 [Apibacter adventoris]PQL94137.1 hypothetical protein C4S77_04070 [Apibacter adventoris]PQL94148.1 hypothetical protein C4S76_06250 [Apibacter adventoris]PQL94317.1 hypothetical protein C4S76_06235 [Apibacter adventoris]
MSSFLAKLEMEGSVYTVLHCHYSFQKNIDSSGKPQGATRGGYLDLTLESNGNSVFIDWMLSQNKTKDGVIIFYRRDAMSKLQEVKFEKSYCISFEEEFDATDNQPMRIRLQLCSKKLSIANISYENSWKLG